MTEIRSNSSSDAVPANGESLFRRAVNDAPLLSARSKAFPVGVGRLAGFLVPMGVAVVVTGLWHGLGGMVTLGAVMVSAGAILIWFYWLSRIDFYSTFLTDGSYVSRRWSFMSTVLRYDSIARVEVTHCSYSTSGIALRGDRGGVVIAITKSEAKDLRPILVFLSQRLHRSVFDERALKLMETGELERC